MHEEIAEGQGEPLELIRFMKADNNDNSDIHLMEDTMKHIMKTVGTKPISIFCVCGPSRGGKSFLLGYMIRALEALENDIDDWMDWNDTSKPLKGFKFRSGAKPETQGIWVWSKPFFMKDKDEKEVAVLLVDTQGTNDEFISSRDMAAIVGLSLLTSSALIFNFSKDLQEDTLTALNTYIEYGKHALRNSNDAGTPFQKLTFLIRDWNHPDHFRYGARGGNDFLKEKLTVKEGQPTESRHVREMISSCFYHLDCFLMPSIGDRALKSDFTGSISELPATFINNLQEFINIQLLQDNITAKEVLGATITAPELLNLLRTYVAIFNYEDSPTPENMWAATSHISNTNAVEKAKGKYRERMKRRQQGKSHLSIEELSEAHTSAIKEALELFKKSTQFENVDIQEKYEKQFVEDAGVSYDEIRKQNETRRQQKIRKASYDAIADFKRELEERYPMEKGKTDFYEEEQIQKWAELRKPYALDDFKEMLSNESMITLIELGRPVEDELNEITNQMKERNRMRRARADKKLGKISEQMWSGFCLSLQQHFEANKMEEDENNLREWADQLKKKTEEEYLTKEKPGNDENHMQLLESLKVSMEIAITELINEHIINIQSVSVASEEALKEYREHYRAEMERVSENVEGVRELTEMHDEISKEILKMFSEQGNLFPSGSEERANLDAVLDIEIEKTFEEVKAEFMKRKEPAANTEMERALTMSFHYYQVKMKRLMGADEFVAEEKFEAEHEQHFKQALEQYQVFSGMALGGNGEAPSDQPLREKIMETYEGIKKRREEEVTSALKCVEECTDEYNKIFKELLGSTLDIAEMGLIHSTCREEALKKFQENFSIRTPDSMEMYQEMLIRNIEDCYREALDAINPVPFTRSSMQSKRISPKRVPLQKSSPQDSSSSVDPLVQYIKLYQDEMDALFKVSIPKNEMELDELHSKVKDIVKASLEKNGRPDLETMRKMEAEYRELHTLYLTKMTLSQSQQKDAPAIGIDLGTTYCCVGVFMDGEVKIIPNHADDGDSTTPSYVSFQEDPDMPGVMHETVGKWAKENAYQNPENTIFDAKRIIGRKMDDPLLQNDMKTWPFEVRGQKENPEVPMVVVNGQYLSPEEVSAKILKKLKGMAEGYLKLPEGSIKKAVITVPAYFNDGQRQATMDAGEIAGLEVLKILNEPTAAARAYCLQRRDTSPRKVLIFDLGGGTFDVAVLGMKPNQYAEVLGVSGDTHLGGEDFDKNLMEYCARTFKAANGIDLFQDKDSDNIKKRLESRRRLRRLQTNCEKVKKELTSGMVATVGVDAIINGVDLSVSITRRKFEELNQAYFQRTMDLVEETLKDLKLKKDHIDDIVLVGGSSKIPKIQELLQNYFVGKILNKSINPDLAVGYGAAVEAALMNGMKSNQETKIQDVTPLAIGIEILDKRFDVILKKNSKIPSSSKTKTYRTSKDGQTALAIKIYQGKDKKSVEKNQWLGEFILSGIPPKPKGQEEIDVVMEITQNGILRVAAKSKGNKSVNNDIVVRENKMRMSVEAKKNARWRILKFK